MIKVLSFLSNENCFAGHSLSTTVLEHKCSAGVSNLSLTMHPFSI